MVFHDNNFKDPKPRTSQNFYSCVLLTVVVQSVMYTIHYIFCVQVKKTIWAGHLPRLGEIRRACNNLFAECKTKRIFGRHVHKCENNIKMDFKEAGFEDVDLVAHL